MSKPKYLDWTAEQLKDYLIHVIQEWSAHPPNELPYPDYECLIQDIRTHFEPEEPDVRFGDTE